MSKVQTPDVPDLRGKKVTSVELSAKIFDVPTNILFMCQVVAAQLAATHQGTHAMKTRGMISGSSKKPFHQKGTGNARQGLIRAPHFTGGGTVHDPRPCDYSQRTPKKMKQGALRSALSGRTCNGRIYVVTAFIEGGTPKMKIAFAALCAIVEDRQAFAVPECNDEITILNLRNISEVHVLWVDQLNTYDVLSADDIVFMQTTLEFFLGTKEEAK